MLATEEDGASCLAKAKANCCDIAVREPCTMGRIRERLSGIMSQFSSMLWRGVE